MFKKFASFVMLSLAIVGAAQAASNSFTKADVVYSVANVRAVYVGQASFQLVYEDGNASQVFSDQGLATWNALKATAPALSSITEVGYNSGVFINLNSYKNIQCQNGTGAPGVATSNGDHVYILWKQAGFSVLADAGCGTYWQIRNASN